jgi:hypothetical protein
MSLGDEKGPPNTEASARDSALQSCREQIARRGEIANKPSVPIGDLTKPADPLDKLGVVKKPEGGVDQFLKKKP